MSHAATCGLGVVQHFADGGRQRVLVSEDRHGQRIADQYDVDRCLIYQARAWIVISGQASDRLVKEFLFAKGSNCNLLARVANRGETHRSSSAPPPWRIEPVRSLDAAVAILNHGRLFVDASLPPI